MMLSQQIQIMVPLSWISRNILLLRLCASRNDEYMKSIVLLRKIHDFDWLFIRFTWHADFLVVAKDYKALEIEAENEANW
jgi:hypothetical protein